jgi:hypothetical protein
LDKDGARGFYALLQELALVLQTPLLVQFLKVERDQPYSGAEVFSIQPGNKDVQAIWTEWGDVLTRGELEWRHEVMAQ